MKTTKEDLIYHYTNCEGVISIIQNNEFWLSNVEYVNDKLENDYSLQVVCNAINKSSLDNGFKKEFIKKFRLTKTKSANTIFILSLTHDHDSLNLWNNYSKNEGYNIGINVEDFIYGLSNHKIGYRINDNLDKRYIPAVGSVLYDETKQLSFFQALYELFFTLSSIKPTSLDESKKIREKQTSIWKLLVMYSYMIKGKTHKIENEFRLVISIPDASKGINFRSRNGLVLPFIIISSEGNKLPFSEITIGPKIDDKIAKNGITQLIKQNNLKLKVNSSSIKLRF